MHKKFPKKLNTGYTIIETMVAISIFLVVIMYGTTALLNANLLHRKSGDMRSIMDNLSFILDDMSRNIRVGYDYYCFNYGGGPIQPSELNTQGSCPGGGNAIAFEHSDGGNQSDLEDQWVYYINEGEIWKSTDSTDTSVQLTTTDDTNEIIIADGSGFSVIGAERWSVGNEEQPLVTIRLVGSINFKGVITPFSLQTSVSQRLIDNY